MSSKISALIRWLLVIFGIYIAFQVVSTVYSFVSGVSLFDTVMLLASDLNQDSENRTNFLIMGTGGGQHDGADLTDTIMVASYNHNYGTLSLFSIPRDFWTEAGDRYGMRINRIYEYEKGRLKESEEALESVSKVASGITGIPIHYYVKVDFQGFIDLIDALGGIEVLVEYDINDPYYPCSNMLDYCPFKISEGLHLLDGETALKYVRSRKTTSDFDRAARQQKVIEAIRVKAQERSILTDLSKIKSIWKLMRANLETNLSVREMLRIGEIASTFDRQNLGQVVLNDEPTLVGGLLMAPNREDYGGAAVLIPQDNSFRQIQQLCQILFGSPKVITDKLTIEVLNGSGKSGVANNAAYYLNRYGLNAAHVGNYPEGELPKTTIYYYDEEIAKPTLDVLQKMIGVQPRIGPVDLKVRGYDITLVLGENWTELK